MKRSQRSSIDPTNTPLLDLLRAPNWQLLPLPEDALSSPVAGSTPVPAEPEAESTAITRAVTQEATRQSNALALEGVPYRDDLAAAAAARSEVTTPSTPRARVSTNRQALSALAGVRQPVASTPANLPSSQVSLCQHSVQM